MTTREQGDSDVHIPAIPPPQSSDRVSPSLYEDLLTCQAKAAWHIGGDRSALPPQPAQLLGVAFHEVLEAVHRGDVGGDPDERREGARQGFDRRVAELYESAHPLLKVKFRSPQRLPYYNQQRELAAVLATEIEGPYGSRSSEGRGGEPVGGPEHWYKSSDGVIVGRPDFVDVAKHEVVDYKTGHIAEGGDVLSEREKRQLALYAFLVQEAGIEVESGRIVRANGEHPSTQVTTADALSEAVDARKALADYNHAASDSVFAALASPSPEGCRFCECKPLCEAFWESAVPDWSEVCGTHVEGTVLENPSMGEVQGVGVLTMRMRVSRGTVPGDREVVIPQVPVSWLTADGDRVPCEGDVVRLVDGRRTPRPEHAEHDQEFEAPTIVVNGDRIASTFWRVEGA